MIRPRIIPCFQINSGNLVNRILFNKKTERYIGDPINTLKLFNEYQPDELSIIDINAWHSNINFEILEKLSNEVFCPLSYGGGVYNFDDAKRIVMMGYEKILFNNSSLNNWEILKKTSEYFGSQSVIMNLDVIKENNCFYIYDYRSNKKLSVELRKFIKDSNLTCVGEILVSVVNLDGSFLGPDLEFLQDIKDLTSKPIIYKGGISSFFDIRTCFLRGISAVMSSNFLIMKKKSSGIVFTNPNEYWKIFEDERV